MQTQQQKGAALLALHRQPKAFIVANAWDAGSTRILAYDRGRPLYEIAHAADRIRALVEAARAQRFPFVLTARAENFLVGQPDLADAIKRLQAYQEAGADVLYALGLTKEADIRTVVQSVDRP